MGDKREVEKNFPWFQLEDKFEVKGETIVPVEQVKGVNTARKENDRKLVRRRG